jgi:hypothetical protein
MGAWGTAPFDNDTAADFLWEVEESGIAAIADALANAVANKDDLQAPDADSAVAAAALVAAARDGCTDMIPSSAIEQFHRLRGSIAADRSLAEQSLTVLDAVLGPNSELADLWAETDEADIWRTSIAELKARIGS